jgi:hypothetical protein
MDTEQRFEAGNITFIVRELHTHRGDGLSVDILAKQPGEDVSVVRLDWFPDCPHYHYNPRTTQGKEIPLDPALIGDTMSFFLEKIPGSLSGMIHGAGFPEVAKAMNAGEVNRAMTQVTIAAKALAKSVVKAA